MIEFSPMPDEALSEGAKQYSAVGSSRISRATDPETISRLPTRDKILLQNIDEANLLQLRGTVVGDKYPNRLTTEEVMGRFGAPLEHHVHKLRRAAVVAGVVVSMLLGRYIDNTRSNELEYAGEQPSITHVFDPYDPANDSSMIFDFEGLSGKDASAKAGSELAYRNIGKLEAVVYGQNVNPKPIAAAIIKRAEEGHAKSVNLSARSAGGPIALGVAAVIADTLNACNKPADSDTSVNVKFVSSTPKVELDNSEIDCPDFRLGFVMMDSSPNGIDSVRPGLLSHTDQLKWAIANIPDIEYSSDINCAVQGISHFLNDPSVLQSINLVKLPYDIDKFCNKVNSPQRATPPLIVQQFDAISAARIKDNLKSIAKLPEQLRPVIVLMQSADKYAFVDGVEMGDHSILSTVAAREYKRDTSDAGLLFKVVRVHGITHANPSFRYKAWNRGMENQVEPAIAALQGLQNQKFVLSQTKVASTKAESPTLLAQEANQDDTPTELPGG